MALKTVQFLALVLTALALVPAGAHLFTLLNKMDLAQEQYFILQNIYRGWALFGIVWIGALLANFALAAMLRGRGRPFILALIAGLCVVVMFAYSSSGPIRPTRRPTTGPPSRPTGSSCGGNGNIHTPSMGW